MIMNLPTAKQTWCLSGSSTLLKVETLFCFQQTRNYENMISILRHFHGCLHSPNFNDEAGVYSTAHTDDKQTLVRVLSFPRERSISEHSAFKSLYSVSLPSGSDVVRQFAKHSPKS